MNTDKSISLTQAECQGQEHRWQAELRLVTHHYLEIRHWLIYTSSLCPEHRASSQVFVKCSVFVALPANVQGEKHINVSFVFVWFYFAKSLFQVLHPPYSNVLHNDVFYK